MAPFQPRVRPMYVCVCNGITDHQIRDVAAAGCRTMAELTMRTGVGAGCGSCLELAAQILDESQRANALPALPVLSQAA